MKRIWLIVIAAFALSCGDSRSTSSEAADDEVMEESTEEDRNPQLVPDDSLGDTRHDIDTISSARGAQRQSERDSVD